MTTNAVRAEDVSITHRASAAKQVYLPCFLSLVNLRDDLRIFFSEFVVSLQVAHLVFVRVGITERIGERRIA